MYNNIATVLYESLNFKTCENKKNQLPIYVRRLNFILYSKTQTQTVKCRNVPFYDFFFGYI